MCDDASPQREAVSQALLRAGYAVVALTSSATELRALVEQAHPDVVVLDLARSARTGLSLVRDVRAASPGTAVVVISAFSSLVADAIEAGACALLDGTDLRELERLLSGLRDTFPAARPEPLGRRGESPLRS